MPDRTKVKLEDIQIEVITVIGNETIKEAIDINEKFMADMIVAIRNGKSPADALCFLADVGSDHLNDPAVQIPRICRIGERKSNEIY